MTRAVPGGDISRSEPVLAANISVDYPRHERVLDNVALEVFPAEIVGLVGQSGSGKTTLALALLKLLEHAGAQVRGRIEVAGADVSSWGERQMASVRGRLASLIPQSPAAALNPALRIETHLREAWHAHSSEPWHAQRERIAELFARAGLPRDGDFRSRFPGQISIGQGQRVLIVMALLHSPRLLIADEPTSSLDTITQSEVLALFREIRDENRLGTLFISHDLATVATLCDRIAVLHNGAIVEAGTVASVLNSPKHAYTRRLVEAAPRWP